MLRTILKAQFRFLIIAALGALAACQAADGTTQAPDTAMVNALMSGLGAVNPDEKPIEYKPRAPLAMPAEPTALPEPETKVAGKASEAWPQNEKNKDFEAVKALYAKRQTGGSDGHENSRLSSQQMRGINVYQNGPRDREAERREEDIGDGDRLTSEEMQRQNSQAAELTKKSRRGSQSALTTRRYLTEPPSAYSTPSDDAPMPEIVEVENKRDSGSDPACAGDNMSLKCRSR